MGAFFALKPKLDDLNIKVVMVQIEEAHTNKWPVGYTYLPTNHANFEDRVQRANEFVKKYNCPYDIYVDGFDNRFEETFRAWPDKYYFLDDSMRVLNNSIYGKTGEMDGKVILDYVHMLQEL